MVKINGRVHNKACERSKQKRCVCRCNGDYHGIYTTSDNENVKSKKKRVYICEAGFNHPDPNNPNYSLREYDIYGHTHYGIDNHRLTIRKDLKNNRFEALKVYFQNNNRLEIAARGSFEEVLAYCNAEKAKHWNSNDILTPCKHKHPKRDLFCKVQ